MTGPAPDCPRCDAGERFVERVGDRWVCNCCSYDWLSAPEPTATAKAPRPGLFKQMPR